jgi:predicted ABC-type ATPase
MTTLVGAVEQVLSVPIRSGKPLAIVVAGHNGSGKSTMWNERLAPLIRIPLVNADRMMMSILPEPPAGNPLPTWAAALRDGDERWMRVAQKGVEAFVIQAMGQNVPFAMETVFSHWRERADGRVESKIDRIRDMQSAGYFVLLLFVGLSDAQLSVGRVLTRVSLGGHAVESGRLIDRFPRTQKAIAAALGVADAAILTDNSREPALAFTVGAGLDSLKRLYSSDGYLSSP